MSPAGHRAAALPLPLETLSAQGDTAWGKAKLLISVLLMVTGLVRAVVS